MCCPLANPVVWDSRARQDLPMLPAGGEQPTQNKAFSWSHMVKEDNRVLKPKLSFVKVIPDKKRYSMCFDKTSPLHANYAFSNQNGEFLQGHMFRLIKKN